MQGITEPDTLAAALFKKNKDEESMFAKDEQILQGAADDMMAISQLLESPNAKSFMTTLANAIQTNKRVLIKGPPNSQPGQSAGMQSAPMSQAPGMDAGSQLY